MTKIVRNEASRTFNASVMLQANINAYTVASYDEMIILIFGGFSTREAN